MKNSQKLYTDQASQFADEINRTGEGAGQALPTPHPPRGRGAEPERPLSNKLILGRDGRKIGSRSTGGSIEIYPSMLVRKRDYSEMEDDYYAMVARFGKKSRVGGSIRGQIDHFSNAARFRMLKVLGKIGREDPPYMVTLTYRSGSVTFDQAKKDLKNFGKRLNRQFGITHETIEEFTNKAGFQKLRKRRKYEGKWAGVWRFEVTTGRGKRARGATPHFHILIWCDEWHGMNLEELDYRLSEMWCEVTKDGGEDRMKYGCNIKPSMGDQSKIKNYMLGHHGKKTDQEATGAGRHWGKLNEDLLFIGKPSKKYSITPDQRHKLDRISRKLIASRRSQEERCVSDLKETHTVISPYDMSRILKLLGIKQD
tara:strand:+ start:607 stop:1710 length:1104 start_codon:yes stop_codon:yes gene_type:complete